MSVNSFCPRKYEDHEIVVASNKVVGHIRVKPSGVLWSPKNGKEPPPGPLCSNVQPAFLRLHQGVPAW